jgi:hypothetical protein
MDCTTTAWHTLGVEDVLQRLDSRADGLDAGEAERRVGLAVNTLLGFVVELRAPGPWTRSSRTRPPASVVGLPLPLLRLRSSGSTR